MPCISTTMLTGLTGCEIHRVLVLSSVMRLGEWPGSPTESATSDVKILPISMFVPVGVVVLPAAAAWARREKRLMLINIQYFDSR